MKYQINETFFEKIDSAQKAWMLGFITADGCIYKRNGHQTMLTISVRDYDVEILELFKKYISPEHSIIQVQDKRRPNTVMSTLQLTSNILCNSLENIGIGPRKTFDLDIANILGNFPKNIVLPSYQDILMAMEIQMYLLMEQLVNPMFEFQAR